MARIIVGSYAVRFPVGGYLSWVLQWLVGLRRLGHDVYFVEKCRWPNACYDPVNDRMGDGCAYGTASLDALLGRFDLARRWCFVDAGGRYHGLSRESVLAVFRSADLFVDLGLAHGDWSEEAAGASLRVLVDGDPGFTQILWDQYVVEGEPLPEYDFHYTVGRNIGTASSTAPTAGRFWRPIFHPIDVDLFPASPVSAAAPFTTVMSWNGRGIRFNGTAYGAKDMEFAKFLDLPSRTSTPLEVAVGGADVPIERLTAAGWGTRSSVSVTLTFDDFRSYIAQSRGEFSVAKNVYVATNSGWFSDRAGAYLASGRPVVLQDTGFGAHLPCGTGLFAVRTVDEAAAAIDAIGSDWNRHSRAAREIAGEYLDVHKVLRGFLAEIGL